MLRRSQLYVPGNNERMVVKAASLGADSVVLDLEDAVPASEKEEARRLVCKLANELDWGDRELCVRVNALGTREFKLDVASMRGQRRIQTILVPKAERVMPAAAIPRGKAILPIIETARGLLNADRVASSKAAVALTYGAADYAASVGGSVSAYLGNETIKTMVAAVAKSHGLEAIDNVFFDLNDPEGFRRDALAARSLGYTGKQIIHPSQIAPANEVFSPTAAELEWARKVMAELSGANQRRLGAIKVDGELVDAVHYRMAKGIVERANAAKPS